MLHQLSVTSDIDSVISCIPFSEEIKTNVAGNIVTFSSENEKKLKDNLTKTIASVIENKYRPLLIMQALRYEHKYLKQDEQTKILASLNGGSTQSHELLLDELSAFLADTNMISIKGFVQFRLPAYKKQLSRTVDHAVNRFLAEKEYSEFIDLLEYFVLCSPPKEKHLHIVVTPNGGFSIFNSEMREITHECAKEIASLYPGDEISFDDILICALITIAPLKITFHNAQRIKTPNLLATVERVFKGKVFYCNNCSLCGEID